MTRLPLTLTAAGLVAWQLVPLTAGTAWAPVLFIGAAALLLAAVLAGLAALESTRKGN